MDFLAQQGPAVLVCLGTASFSPPFVPGSRPLSWGWGPSASSLTPAQLLLAEPIYPPAACYTGGGFVGEQKGERTRGPLSIRMASRLEKTFMPTAHWRPLPISQNVRSPRPGRRPPDLSVNHPYTKRPPVSLLEK